MCPSSVINSSLRFSCPSGSPASRSAGAKCLVCALVRHVFLAEPFQVRRFPQVHGSQVTFLCGGAQLWFQTALPRSGYWGSTCQWAACVGPSLRGEDTPIAWSMRGIGCSGELASWTTGQALLDPGSLLRAADRQQSTELRHRLTSILGFPPFLNGLAFQSKLFKGD